MSSTRLPYDDSVYSSYIKQSTGNTHYRISETFTRDLSCYPDVSRGHPSNFINHDKEQVEIENKLSNRDTPVQKYYEHQSSVDSKPVVSGTNVPNMCEGFISSNSLLTHPKSEYRDLSTENYNKTYLERNPQDVVPDYISHFGNNSRKIAIDNFKKFSSS